MRKRFDRDCVVLLLCLGVVVAGPATAQIPDTFDNLEVLPADIERRELIGVMRSFAGALGVRCNHCHVGENAETLEGFDFASDEKETKRTARAMMRMVDAINGELLPTTGRAELIEVKCVTCHHGIARPRSLRDEILETLEADGVDAAIAQYRAARDKHYGRGVYDFGPGTLNNLTELTAREHQDLESAEKLIRANLEYHPDAAYSHFLLSQVQLRGGDREGAIATLEKVVELAPDNEFFAGQLERARGAGGEEGQ